MSAQEFQSPKEQKSHPLALKIAFGVGLVLVCGFVAIALVVSWVSSQGKKGEGSAKQQVAISDVAWVSSRVSNAASIGGTVGVIGNKLVAEDPAEFGGVKSIYDLPPNLTIRKGDTAADAKPVASETEIGSFWCVSMRNPVNEDEYIWQRTSDANPQTGKKLSEGC